MTYSSEPYDPSEMPDDLGPPPPPDLGPTEEQATFDQEPWAPGHPGLSDDAADSGYIDPRGELPPEPPAEPAGTPGSVMPSGQPGNSEDLPPEIELNDPAPPPPVPGGLGDTDRPPPTGDSGPADLPPRPPGSTGIASEVMPAGQPGSSVHEVEPPPVDLTYPGTDHPPGIPLPGLEFSPDQFPADEPGMIELEHDPLSAFPPDDVFSWFPATQVVANVTVYCGVTIDPHDLAAAAAELGLDPHAALSGSDTEGAAQLLQHVGVAAEAGTGDVDVLVDHVAAGGVVVVNVESTQILEAPVTMSVESIDDRGTVELRGHGRTTGGAYEVSTESFRQAWQNQDSRMVVAAPLTGSPPMAGPSADLQATPAAAVSAEGRADPMFEPITSSKGDAGDGFRTALILLPALALGGLLARKGTSTK